MDAMNSPRDAPCPPEGSGSPRQRPAFSTSPSFPMTAAGSRRWRRQSESACRPRSSARERWPAEVGAEADTEALQATVGNGQTTRTGPRVDETHDRGREPSVVGQGVGVPRRDLLLQTVARPSLALRRGSQPCPSHRRRRRPDPRRDPLDRGRRRVRPRADRRPSISEGQARLDLHKRRSHAHQA